MPPASPLVPLTVLSGFLGSGKTTLLSRALAASGASHVAVIVNELGQIGLDHRRVTHLAEQIVLLPNGCLCCALRDDLGATLRDLVEAQDAGAAPVERVVLETSGLANPAPILSTVEGDPLLRRRIAVEHFVVACDAEHAHHHQRFAEWHAQVAAADVLAITKVDRAGPSRTRLATRLARRTNPAAAVLDGRALDLLRLPGKMGSTSAFAENGHHHHHSPGVSTASAVIRSPVETAPVVVWLSALLHAHGSAILRLKAMLDTGAGQGPLVLDAVQHVVYPPCHLPSWDGPRSSAIVAVTSGLDARQVVAGFVAAIERPTVTRGGSTTRSEGSPSARTVGGARAGGSSRTRSSGAM